MFKALNDQLAIGSLAQPGDLQEVARQGYRTVVDLCTEAEGRQLDQATVQEAGLAYTSFPISLKNLTPETLAAFKALVASSDRPIYVRCASALRAGVFTLLAIAAQEGWSEAQYTAAFQELGIDQKPNCPLGQFAQNYFAHNA